MVQTITAMDKAIALKRLEIVRADLSSLSRATQALKSARGRRGTLTNVLRNKQNLASLIREKQILALKKKEFEELISREVINGDTSIQTSASTPLRKSFLDGKKGKLIQVLAQSKRPFFNGRSL